MASEQCPTAPRASLPPPRPTLAPYATAQYPTGCPADVDCALPYPEQSKMGCPHLENMLKGAVSGCPFLRDLAERHGSSYAEQIAVQPARPAVRGSTPVLEEGVEGFQATLALFHGAAGVVPLARFQQATGPGPEAPGKLASVLGPLVSVCCLEAPEPL